MQAYQPTTGTPVGWYADGRVAAVENGYGRGRTLLLGTMPGAGNVAHADDNAAFFASLLDQQQQVRSSDARIKARVHAGAGGLYLWVANPTRQSVAVQLTLSDAVGDFAGTRTVRGAQAGGDGRCVGLTAPARDVTVLELCS